MKYLCLHKILWLLIVLAYTFIEIALVLVIYIAYVLWNFKFPQTNIWKNIHTGVSRWDGEFHKDFNPWQTIVRRYGSRKALKIRK